MSVPCLLSYFENQTIQLVHHFDHSRSGFSRENIHKMRLSVKRIKSFFRFLDFQSSSAFDIKKEIAPYRELFKNYGELRDLQVQMGLVRHYAAEMKLDLADYLLFLKERENVEKRQLRNLQTSLEHAHFSRIIADNRQSIKKNVKGSIKRPMHAFLLNRSNKLIKKAAHFSNDESIHNARIRLKEIHYILELHIQCFTGKKEYFRQKLLEMKMVEDQLGTWHDHVIALDYFHSFSVIHDQRKMRNKKFKALRSKIFLEKRRLKKLIIPAVQTLEFKF